MGPYTQHLGFLFLVLRAFLLHPCRRFYDGGLQAGDFIPDVECKWCGEDYPLSPPFW